MGWFDDFLSGGSTDDLYGSSGGSSFTPVSSDDWNAAVLWKPSIDSSATYQGLSDGNLTVAAQKAKATGNLKVENVLNFVIKYGDAVLTSLTKNGIIKNKNQLYAGQINEQAYDAYIQRGAAVAPTVQRSTTGLFGLDFSNPTTLIILAVLIFLLVKTFQTPAKTK